MSRNALTGQVLRLASDSSRRPYICRACLAQSTRQITTSASRNASSQQPFFKRIQDSLFGSKESKAAEAKREAARKQQLEQIKESGREKKTVRIDGGRVYEIAEIVDPTTHSDYIVARDWKGLERIGGPEWVRARADGGEKYTGFLPPKQLKLEWEEWAVLLHNITTEVLALKQSGRDVLQVCNARTIDTDKLSRASEVAVLAGISETETALEERAEGALKLELDQALKYDGGEISMGMQLDDPRVKFAIVKRAMQLTGNRVPDILISNAKDFQQLHKAFATKEAPKKLHDTRELQQLGDVANIQVHASRRTRVHRDKEIGRWKLIEEEMNVRNMPTRGMSKGAASRAS